MLTQVSAASFSYSGYRRFALPIVVLLACIAMASGCSRDEPPSAAITYSEKPPAVTKEVYLFAVHPLHAPKRLFEVYEPLIDYLNAHLGDTSLKLEASADYHAFEEKLVQRKAHFALPNPYQTLVSMKQGYHVFAKMGDDQNFRGVILVRQDSGISTPQQLTGKVVSYPAPTALAAAIMPQWMLHEMGVDVRRGLTNRYVGTQESSIMSVLLGESIAGATWPAPWRAFQREYPDRAAQLKVMWETPPLVNNSLVARNDIPAPLVDRVMHLLTTLHKSTEGREILARLELSQFQTADNKTYGVVQEFIDRFEAEVRPISEGT